MIKITQKQAIEILKDTRPQKVIAFDYGISVGYLGYIKQCNGRFAGLRKYRVPRVKIDPKSARLIRRSTKSERTLANKYGVSRQTIRNVRKRVGKWSEV